MGGDRAYLRSPPESGPSTLGLADQAWAGPAVATVIAPVTPVVLAVITPVTPVVTAVITTVMTPAEQPGAIPSIS